MEMSDGKRCATLPCVSVVVPVRNGAATIARTLRSLVPDVGLIREILVLDDGSTDQTPAIASRMAQLYGLPLEVIPVCAGSAGGARNAGLAQATGEFIYLLDADDEVVAGGLSLLHEALCRDKRAGLSIGANIRRTQGRPDKLKVPVGYGDKPAENAHNYLRNGIWPIAMGSALVVSARLGSLRFPEAIGLDEDTCFWAALLAREQVATIASPVLLYHHDETRMADRFLRAPRRTLLAISGEFNRLAAFGIDGATLQWRKAWIALRIARQLLISRRYAEAAYILRVARAHPAFRQGWKVFQYRLRIGTGLALKNWRSGISAEPQPHGGQRTLILTYDPAWPPVSGADLRNWGNAKAAAQSGPVLLVSVRPHEVSAPPPEADVIIASLERAGEGRMPSLARRRTRIEPRISAVALERLLDMAGAFRPDAMVVEGIPLFRLIPPLRRLVQLLILDMHNVESELVSQQDERATPMMQLKRLLRNDAARIRRLEGKAATMVDRVWVCSADDRERLLAFARPGAVDIVPNGIPRCDETPTGLAPLPPLDGGCPTLLFVGHLGYWPNVEAAQCLAQSILPRIRNRFSRAELILAGRYPKPAVRALAELPGVQLVEAPQDLAALYRRSQLCVAPIRAGGGTRIKIMEAMAWGLAVVATPLAVEGLGLADGIDVSLADTDEGLARLACELCDDPARLERQRLFAHAFVRLQFGPRAIHDAVRRGLNITEDGCP